MALDLGLVSHNSEHAAIGRLTTLSKDNHLNAVDRLVDSVSKQHSFILGYRVHVSKVCLSGCLLKLLNLNLREASWHGEDRIFENNI